jgi:general secretion pathway protein G
VRAVDPAARHSTRGMTLIEIMVVITILAMIATAVSVSVLQRLEEARVEQARMDIANIGNALKLYVVKTGHYPEQAGGLDELFRLQFLDRPPRDPWGKPYLYSLDRDGPTVMSLGRDGAPGGTGFDADLSSRAPSAEGVSSR